MTSEENREIAATARAYVNAMMNESTQKALEQLCVAEREEMLDQLPPNMPEPAEFTTFQVDVRKVTVHDDIASAEVQVQDNPVVKEPWSMYFQKEQGVWKVCADAQTRMPHN